MENWKRILLYAATLLLAVGMALGSLRFVRPANCQTLCSEPLQAPCPTGACRFGEQRAGFPLPILTDNEAGSPPGGWGKIGPEDIPNPFFFVIDALFYGLLLWLPISAARIISRRAGTRALTALALPLVGVVLGLVVGFLLYRPQSQVRPVFSGDRRIAIIGSWRAVDRPTGKEFIFRFYDAPRVTMTPPGSSGQIDGEYRWTPAGALRLSFFTMSSQPSTEEGLCSIVAAFMRSACQVKHSDPASYPAPDVVSAGAYPALPAPTQGPVVFNTINEEFQVSIAGEQLTLKLPSGEKQDFTRIVKAP